MFDLYVGGCGMRVGLNHNERCCIIIFLVSHHLPIVTKENHENSVKAAVHRVEVPSLRVSDSDPVCNRYSTLFDCVFLQFC